MARQLGLYIGEKRAQVLEINYRKDHVQVLNGFEIPVEPGESVSELVGKLRENIKKHGLKTRRVNILFSPKNLKTKTAECPMMTYRELQSFVKREIQRTTQIQLSDLVIDYIKLEDFTEKGIRKTRLNIYYIEKDAINEYLFLCRSLKLKPVIFSTVFFSCVSAIQDMLSVEEQRSGLTLAVLNKEDTPIMMFQKSQLLFSRELPFGTESGDRPDENIRRVFSEINRSVMYFTQKQSETPLSKLLITGNIEPYEESCRKQAALVALPTEIFKLEDYVDVSAYSGEPVDWNNYFISYSAAVLEESDTSINLVPYEVVEKRLRFAKNFLMFLLLMIVIALTGLSYVWFKTALASERKALQTEIGSLELMKSRMKENLRRMESIEYQQQIIVEFQKLMEGFPNWEALLNDLGHIAPKQMVFKELDINHINEQWILSIRGEVLTETQPKAQEVFRTFLTSFKLSPYVKHVFVDSMNSEAKTKGLKSNAFTMYDEEIMKGFISFNLTAKLRMNKSL